MKQKIRIIYNQKEWINNISEALMEMISEAKKKKIRMVILMDRVPELIFILYELFYNNITFVPIDPEQPVEMIEYMINDSGADVVITQKKYQSVVNDVNLFIVDDDKYIKINKFLKKDDNQIAYVIYTSGTTGYPKGVEISRDALENFIEGISKKINFVEDEKIACLTTISFDIFILESIIALYKKLIVVLANNEEQRNPRLLSDFIEKNKIEFIQMTPSRMQLLVNYDPNLLCLKYVNTILIGGEVFHESLLRILKSKTKSRIFNMYGPTETTIWSTVSEVTNKDYIDIGTPILNTDIYIVDDNLRIVDAGDKGEICIAGKSLANGYVGNEELTNEKFVRLPHKSKIVVYRTGDIGRYNKDGNLEYLGRIDNQVKLRGYRIELEGIEAHINSFQDIEQSIVILDNNFMSGSLKAFYTSKKNIDKNNL